MGFAKRFLSFMADPPSTKWFQSWGLNRDRAYMELTAGTPITLFQ
jgi:hypothetical protein